MNESYLSLMKHNKKRQQCRCFSHSCNNVQQLAITGNHGQHHFIDYRSEGCYNGGADETQGYDTKEV